ncbi:protein-L-histidine N-pros-methyltransferase [Aethina tumida]|uniref:protein-L-histidine N-pros-methyltransferase n=1 Tax=Aethina tumida TaxID=116153 RepID=UPI0021478A36|nr:protein-L-histidine N-pros-methyltransferase [Aethina tumida]
MTESEHCQSIDDNILKCGIGAGELSPSWSFRPRGSLARALYQKQQHDEFLSHFDKKIWYQCDLKRLPDDLASKFVQLHPDDETNKFLIRSEEKSDWIFTQLWHSLVKFFLSWFMTHTAINGWLQRGSMFVVSQPQFLKLVREKEGWVGDTLLDLGAGDGEVTAHLAPLFNKVYATEACATMRGLLQRKGYQVLDLDNWYEDRKFDVISCLNLIDRCDKPLEILKQIRQSLRPDGRVLLAVVLPFSAYVESGAPDFKPQELLPINGSTFEEQVRSAVHEVFAPAGFEVESWSRVPYLCEGDLQQSYYWLDDAIFVLKLANC